MTFAGSAVLNGIIVGTSGVWSEFDEMFSYWTAASIQALVYHKIRLREENVPEETFLYTGQ